jgi:hypothetical protein
LVNKVRQIQAMCNTKRQVIFTVKEGSGCNYAFFSWYSDHPKTGQVQNWKFQLVSGILKTNHTKTWQICLVLGCC